MRINRKNIKLIDEKIVNKLVSKWAPIFKEKLGLKDWKIRIHVRSSRKNSSNRRQSRGCVACVWIDWPFKKRTADIIIYFNKHDSLTECLDSLLHEYLHIALSEVLHVRHKKLEIVHCVEEYLVSKVAGLLTELYRI